jgi:hypothetical protein
MNINLEKIRELNRTLIEQALDESRRKPLPRIEGAKYFPSANISTRLVPEFRRELMPFEIPAVFVVGNDGTYLGAGHEENLWPDALSELLERGCSIDYLLVSPKESSVQSFKSLVRDAERKGWTGKLTLLRGPANLDALPLHVRQALDVWSTHHFIVFTDPKLLWLEGRHDENSTIATDCQFVPRKVAETSWVWEIYDKAVKSVRPYLEELPLAEIQELAPT